MIVFGNNTSAQVTSGGTTAPSAGTTESWTVTAVTGFPATLGAGEWFHVADTASLTEKAKVTAITGSGPYTWTVTRGDEGTVTAHLANFTVQQAVTAGDFQAMCQGRATAPDYVITQDANAVYCIKTADGSTAYDGSDAGAALQAAVTALASTGGRVEFQPGSAYTWSSVPQLPLNLPEWLQIVGNGSRVNLTAAGTRFLDFNHSPTAGSYHQNIWVEGFHVDISGYTWSGHHHIVLGNVVANDYSSGANCNFARIVVRDILGTGGSTATLTTSTTEQLWVYISSEDTKTGSRANTGTDVLIERCQFYGGSQGVVVYGTYDFQTPAYDAGFTWDRVTIRDIVHDIGSDPDNTTGLFYAHVQVGGGAHVGTVHVENIWGRGSRDVGIEIDNALDAKVRHVYMRNVHGGAVTCTNFNAPPNVHQQRYLLEDIHFRTDAGRLAAGNCGVFGLSPSNDNTGAQQAFGRLTARGLTRYVNGTSMYDIVTADPGAMLAVISCCPDEVEISESSLYAEALSQTSTSATSYPACVQAYNPATGVQKYKLTLRDIDSYIAGSVTGAGAIPPITTAYMVSSNCDLDMDNCSSSITWTNPGTGNEFAVEVSSGVLGDGGGTVSGRISRLRVPLQNDTGGYGITIGGTSALTIPGQLVISDCDFSGMAGGTEVNFEATSNAAKVFIEGRNTWVTMPRAAVTVSSPATTVGQQYLGVPGTLSLTATTITLVSLSMDNTTYYNVFETAATVTAASVHVVNAQYFKVSYTGTLVCKLIPDS